MQNNGIEATIRTVCSRPLQVDISPFDLESGVRVTCANFKLVFLGLSLLDLGPDIIL